MKYRLFTMKNDPGKLIVRVYDKLKPDKTGRVPCWDDKEDRWRCINVRWLVRHRVLHMNLAK